MATCDDSLERASCDSDAAVLDDYHVVAGRHWRVGKVITFVELRADNGYLGRTLNVHCQCTRSCVCCYHRQLRHLPCNRNVTPIYPLERVLYGTN